MSDLIQFIFGALIAFIITSITILECNEGYRDTASAYCNNIASVGEKCVPAGQKDTKTPLCKCVIEKTKPEETAKVFTDMGKK